MEVGARIEELGYLWYEDPLPALDIHGYRRLKQNLRIPLMATEVTPGGLQALAHGDIHAPTGPGLGVDVDWELINASVTQVIS
jgi:L-alanine-DL-glutamate epimerase-like enolase superfamily enzyme